MSDGEVVTIFCIFEDVQPVGNVCLSSIQLLCSHHLGWIPLYDSAIIEIVMFITSWSHLDQVTDTGSGPSLS